MPSVRQTILETLNLRGPLGIDEIAQAAGLSKMAARYHMALLERSGLVLLCGYEHRGSVGRPPVRYAVADAAHDHLPKHYEVLATQLIDEVTRSLGTKRARTILRRAGRRLASAAPHLRRVERMPARLERVTRFLSERGYQTSWEQAGDRYILIVHDCPYREVARSRPLVCEMDVALLGALLGTPFRATQRIADQAQACHFIMTARDSER